MPEVQFAVSECVYGWTAAYLQEDTRLTVRIALQPDPDVDTGTLATCRSRWKTGIEQAWSNQFACCRNPGCTNRRNLTLQVTWVSSDGHALVRVKKGDGRSNMQLWHTMDSGRVAAHEVGHLLGNPDEYADPICPARNPVGTGTIMDVVSGPIAKRHCTRFCEQIDEVVA